MWRFDGREDVCNISFCVKVTHSLSLSLSHTHTHTHTHTGQEPRNVSAVLSYDMKRGIPAGSPGK